MNAKLLAGLMTAALVGYFLLLARQAVILISSGGLLAVLGAAILILPVIGVYAVAQEWRFGSRVQHLADHLQRRGGLPIDDLPRTASGRPQRAAAEAVFTVRAEAVDRRPEDPAAWFRLAVAYDDAGDRKRGRAAMRTAVALHGRGAHSDRTAQI